MIDFDVLIANVVNNSRAAGFARGRRLPDDADNRAEDAAIEALRKALRPEGTATIPAGWKLVPVEPTTQMVEAGEVPDLPQDLATCSHVYAFAAFKRIYKAMVEASPSPQDSAAK